MTKRLETLEIRRKICEVSILRHTNSPTEIARIMTHELNHKITRYRVSDHLFEIRKEREHRARGLATDTYQATADDELRKLTETAESIRLAIPDCKAGMQRSAMVHAWMTLLERRQIVMEDMILYPLMSPWHIPAEVAKAIEENKKQIT